MKDMGYDVSHYTSIDPLFGTMQDFDHLVDSLHRNEIKIIIDQVLSHSSNQLLKPLSKAHKVKHL